MVDDVMENRDILACLLSSMGARVQLARNGAEALVCLDDCMADLLFIDVSMPTLDGVDTLNTIKARYGKQAPVCIVITASVLRHETSRYLELGFDDFIAKPFLFETVFQCLQKYLSVEIAYDMENDAIAAPAVTVHQVQPLPAILYQRLLDAVDAGWVNGIEVLLDELAEINVVAGAWRSLLNQYDMDALREAIERAGVLQE